MIRVSIWTTYFTRQAMVKNLCRQLSEQLAEQAVFKVTHFIIDDGSTRRLSHKLTELDHDHYRIELYRQSENLGKMGYDQTTTNILQKVRTIPCEYVMQISDDYQLCEEFFEYLEELIGTLPRYGMINFTLDVRFIDDYGRMKNLLDGCCLIPRSIMAQIGWRVPFIPPSAKRYSSGVWRAICKRIFEVNPFASIHHVNYSLMKHLGVNRSKLNPKQRKKIPIETRAFKDDWPGQECGFLDLWEPKPPHLTERTKVRVSWGLGNSIESCFVGLQAYQRYGHVDFQYIPSGLFHDDKMAFFKVIAKHLGGKCTTHLEGEYDHVIDAIWRQIPQNEVEQHVQVCKHNQLYCDRADGAISEVLPIDWPQFRGSDFNNDLIKWDIVLCNGSANDPIWINKRYHRWCEVVEELSTDYSIACVGKPDEYISGAVNMTDLNIYETFDLISKAKLFMGNDSGLYHFANAIGKPNVVVWTMTSPEKNRHPVFHKTSFPVYPTSHCFPCQELRGSFDRGKRGKCFGCENAHLEPQRVIDRVREIFTDWIDNDE